MVIRKKILRSYVVEDENGSEYNRNRRHLRVNKARSDAKRQEESNNLSQESTSRNLERLNNESLNLQ